MFRSYLLVPLTLLAFTAGTARGVEEIKVTSPAFGHGKTMPKTYTADGKNVSPPLRWTAGPKGTQCYAIICDDPDAPRGVFVHWVIFNIPAKTHQFSPGVPAKKTLESGARQGTNNMGKIGYKGPAPPRGKPHHYHFKVFALDKRLGLKAGANKKLLLAAMKDHVLAWGEIIGLYGRR
jgi:Raf kinase inhibitor-like YbhB/YbcL family protein